MKFLLPVLFVVGMLINGETSQNSYMRVDITKPAKIYSNTDSQYKIEVGNVSGNSGNPTNLTNFEVSFYGQKETFESASVPPTSVVEDSNGVTIRWTTFPSLVPGEHFEIDVVLKAGDLTGMNTVLTTTTVKAKNETGSLSLSITLPAIVSVYTPTPIFNFIVYPGHTSDGYHRYSDSEIAANYPSTNAVYSNYFIGKPISEPDNTGCKVCIDGRWVMRPCAKTSEISSVGSFPIDIQLGHPVYLNNLEFVWNIVVLEIPGRGIPYRFGCTYRNRIYFHGPLGYGWDFDYNIRLVPNPIDANQVILYDGSGRGDSYIVLSDGTFLPPESHFKKIIKENDNFLLLRDSNGSVFRFYPLDNSNQAGKISSITNRCGGKLTFQYNAQGQLVTVWDSLSRTISHEYDFRGHLVKIRDFSGREVIFTYDEQDNLIAVRSPIVNNTPNGNDFPQGKTWSFTYSKNFTDDNLNHNLLTISAPNEMVTGTAHVTNFYDSDDRLITQEWGGINATGIQAGGNIAYARTVVNVDVDENNPDLPREKLIAIDRTGNESEFWFNNTKHLIRKEEKTRGIRPSDPVSFITTYKYNAAGLLKEITLPNGNRSLYEYDEGNADQFQQGNLLSVMQIPDATRGGEQQYRKVSYEYEPVFNQVLKVTEERGNDPSYTPPNGGSNTPGRYTREYIPDYFELDMDTPGCVCGFTLRQLVEKFGIDISRVQSRLNQGDINGDGQAHICGNVILVRYPVVHLRTNSPQSTIEESTNQVIEQRFKFNKYGQTEWLETPEGEITVYIGIMQRQTRMVMASMYAVTIQSGAGHLTKQMVDT